MMDIFINSVGNQPGKGRSLADQNWVDPTRA